MSAKLYKIEKSGWILTIWEIWKINFFGEKKRHCFLYIRVSVSLSGFSNLWPGEWFSSEYSKQKQKRREKEKPKSNEAVFFSRCHIFSPNKSILFHYKWVWWERWSWHVFLLLFLLHFACINVVKATTPAVSESNYHRPSNWLPMNR